MTANPPCKHCSSIKTRIHCGNTACSWIVCLSCNQLSAVEKV